MCKLVARIAPVMLLFAFLSCANGFRFKGHTDRQLAQQGEGAESNMVKTKTSAHLESSSLVSARTMPVWLTAICQAATSAVRSGAVRAGDQAVPLLQQHATTYLEDSVGRAAKWASGSRNLKLTIMNDLGNQDSDQHAFVEHVTFRRGDFGRNYDAISAPIPPQGTWSLELKLQKDKTEIEATILVVKACDPSAKWYITVAKSAGGSPKAVVGYGNPAQLTDSKAMHGVGRQGDDFVVRLKVAEGSYAMRMGLGA